MQALVLRLLGLDRRSFLVLGPDGLTSLTCMLSHIRVIRDIRVFKGD